MNSAPLVSVIMPAYNSADFIATSIQSVIDQEYQKWELIVIDDASVDKTISFVENFQAKDQRISLLQNTSNLGAGATRNVGIKKARGRFIAFLDADDLWLPEKLKIQVPFLIDNNLSMTFSSYFLMEETGNLLPRIVEALPELTYEKLLRSNYVGNLTGIYDTTKTGKVFAPQMRKRQDWALWLTILKAPGKTKSILQPLAVYRIRENSLSNNKWNLVKYNFRIYSYFLKFGRVKSIKYMAVFLWEHFYVKNQQVKDLK